MSDFCSVIFCFLTVRCNVVMVDIYSCGPLLMRHFLLIFAWLFCVLMLSPTLGYAHTSDEGLGTVGPVGPVGPAAADQSLTILDKVHTFYNDSWGDLMVILKWGFGVVGFVVTVAIPSGLTIYFQRENKKVIKDRRELNELKLRIEISETDQLKKLAEASVSLEQKIAVAVSSSKDEIQVQFLAASREMGADVGGKVGRLEQELRQKISRAEGAVHLVQGNFLKKTYPNALPAIISYLNAGIHFIIGEDYQHALVVMRILVEGDCLYLGLNKENLTKYPELKSKSEQLILLMAGCDQDGDIRDYSKLLQDELEEAMLREPPVEPESE